MAKKAKFFLGLPYIIVLILQILPMTHMLMGTLARFDKKKWILGIVYFFTAGFFAIGWIADVYSLLKYGRYKVLF